MEEKRYRAINFDLKKTLLKMYYSSSNPENAYRELKRYFLRTGFFHRQWSGYRSDKPMSDIEVMIYADNLLRKFPWIIKCANKFDITIVGKVYDILDLHDQGLIGRVERYREKDENSKNSNKSSLDLKIQQAQKRIDSKDNSKQKNRENETRRHR